MIREEDVRAVERAGRRFTGAELTRNAISMPWWKVADESRGWQRRGGALMAPVGRMTYSNRWGATWR